MADEEQIVKFLSTVLSGLNQRMPTPVEEAGMETQANRLSLDLSKLEMEKAAQDSLDAMRKKEFGLKKKVTESQIATNKIAGQMNIADVFGGQYTDMSQIPTGTQTISERGLAINERSAERELDRQYLQTYGVVYDDFRPGMQTLKQVSDQKTLDAYNVTHFGTATPGKDTKSYQARTFGITESQAATIDTFKYVTQKGDTLNIPVNMGNASQIMGADVQNSLINYQLKTEQKKLGLYSSFKPHNVIHVPNLSMWRPGEKFKPIHYELDTDPASKTVGTVKKIKTGVEEKTGARGLISQIDREISVLEEQSPYILQLWDSMSATDQAIWSTSLQKLNTILDRNAYKNWSNAALMDSDINSITMLKERLLSLEAKQKFAITSSLIKASGN